MQVFHKLTIQSTCRAKCFQEKVVYSGHQKANCLCLHTLTTPSTGLEKYLNSTLPVGQVTLKFCLPGALPRLPKFSNSLIIHKLKNGSQQACFNVINP